MSIDLLMEPYAALCKAELPGRIPLEFCISNVESLLGTLGIQWNLARGELSHEEAMNLLQAVQSHEAPQDSEWRDQRERLITLLEMYRIWREQPPETASTQIQAWAGTYPGLADKTAALPVERRRPRMVLQ